MTEDSPLVIYIGAADQPHALETLEGNGSDRVVIIPEKTWKRENEIIREREREACAELVEAAALDGCSEFRARVASEIRARTVQREKEI
jgi:PHD/YefM family antitoxin component YafN of YafNO toxin-antitoxin module